MPALPWWGYLLVKLAINVGLPQLIKIFPGIPKWVLDIIEELLEKMKDPNQSNSSARKMAIAKIRGGSGVATPPDTLKD